MTIDFQCACGKKFRVNDDFAGKRAKCNACGESVTVPNAGGSKVGAQKPAVVAAPAVASPSQIASAKPTIPAVPPPTIRPSLWRAWQMYPLVPALCVLFAVAIVGVGLILLPWLAVAAVLPLGLLFRHSVQVQRRIAELKIEPGLIISNDPPLVATLVDLAQTPGLAWDYIRIDSTSLPANIQRGDRHPLAVRRIATAGANHFTDFQAQSLIKLTSDPTLLTTAVKSVAEARWQEFNVAWETILQQDTPGLYKVPTKPRQGNPIAREKLEQILASSLTHQPAAGRYLAKAGLPPPIVQAAQASYASDVDSAMILALVKCDHETTGRFSLMFDTLGLRFKIGDLGTDIAWTDMWTVGITGRNLEIVMTSGLRMAIPTQAFAKNAVEIELALARICELP